MEKVLAYVLDRYDKKLKSLLPEEEYVQFCDECAKEVFKVTIEGMDDGDFKDFVLEHFEEIVNGEV